MQFQFDSFADAIAMSGHGPFVWSAYAMTLLVLACLLVIPYRRHRQELQKIAEQQRLASRRDGTSAKAPSEAS